MPDSWVGTWATAPMNVWAGDAVLYGFHNQTVRQIVRISLGGKRFRVRFSNEYGASRIPIGGAAIALASEGGRIVPGSSRRLTFGGRPDAILVGGAPLFSDPVDLDADDLSKLAISIFFSGFAPVETYHFTSRQTAYVSQFGSHLEAEEMPLLQTSESSYFLGSVLVEADADTRAIACFGDSITDGTASTVDINARWPNYLAQRLSEAGKLRKRPVLNLGLDGNRLMTGRGRGAAALARFDRDVLSQPNVGHAIVLLGINDLGWPDSMLGPAEESVTAEDIIQSYRQLIDRAHMHGIKAYLGTLTPFRDCFNGLAFATYFSPEKEKARLVVNEWIRTSGAPDAVIDFDAAVTDGRTPPGLLPDYDCGDHLHPSDAGYRHMAENIDLGLFD